MLPRPEKRENSRKSSKLVEEDPGTYLCFLNLHALGYPKSVVSFLKKKPQQWANLSIQIPWLQPKLS
jgi:hypothetical protein